MTWNTTANLVTYMAAQEHCSPDERTGSGGTAEKVSGGRRVAHPLAFGIPKGCGL